MTKLPRYVRPKLLASGKEAFFWELPTWAKPPAVRNGQTCPLVSTALGTDKAEAIRKGEIINAAFDGWKKGDKAELVEGTVAWLFAWYRNQDRFTTKTYKTKADYRRIMDRVVAEKMKTGTFGQRRAGAINAEAADRLYTRFKKHGKRQASYAMQVCRLVWRWAVRHHDKTGVTFNPFAGMGIETGAETGNRPTSRTEYDAYRKTARELGFQSMATAAALSFELCQRVWDVFGFVDPDGRKQRGLVWTNYKPSESFVFQQSKTKTPMFLPMYDSVEGERVPLYPDLVEELERTPQTALLIVVEERSGLPYDPYRMAKVHRKICDKAGLPKDMKFTGFRHGGVTELGDAGVADVRPISGHKEMKTTAIYNKMNEQKARQVAAKRRQYVAALIEDVGMPDGIVSEQKGGKSS